MKNAEEEKSVSCSRTVGGEEGSRRRMNMKVNRGIRRKGEEEGRRRKRRMNR